MNSTTDKRFGKFANLGIIKKSLFCTFPNIPEKLPLANSSPMATSLCFTETNLKKYSDNTIYSINNFNKQQIVFYVKFK